MNNTLLAHTYEFLLTRKCNLNCTYCFEKDKSGADADLEKIYSVVLNNDDFLDLSPSRFYMFGGEPLLNVEFLDRFAQKILSNEELSQKTKNTYIKSIFHNITTNGTLIDKVLEILKKYNASLQISLDGPEDVNDLCRVDYNGKGHFKEIINNIKLCQENNIRYCIHGAVGSQNYKNFARILKWIIEMQLDNPQCNGIAELLYHNYLQIVFEDNISDDDIDELLRQYEEVVKLILFSDVFKDYSIKERKDCACGFLARHGSRCSAANNMFAFDADMYIYPCHRLMTSGKEKDKHEYALGQIGSKESWNYKFYEQFLDAPNKEVLYGPVYNFDGRSTSMSFNFMANWCPSTNFEYTGITNVYPSKHNVLLAELQNFIPRLAEYYNLDIYQYMKEHKD